MTPSLRSPDWALNATLLRIAGCGQRPQHVEACQLVSALHCARGRAASPGPHQGPAGLQLPSRTQFALLGSVKSCEGFYFSAAISLPLRGAQRCSRRGGGSPPAHHGYIIHRRPIRLSQAGNLLNGYNSLVPSRFDRQKDGNLTDATARRLSVFLVEDEAIIRMMIAGMVEELGHDVAVEAGNITDALKLATTADVGIAILDINVGGQNIAPVAEILSHRHISMMSQSG